ncbi:hypothetical protein Tco_1259834, partial [Tanacetum coccineum]
TTSAVGVGRVLSAKRKLHTDKIDDAFQAYSALCSRSVSKRCLVDLLQSATISSFCLEGAVDFEGFREYTDCCATSSATNMPVAVGTISSRNPQPTYNDGVNSTFIHNEDANQTDPSASNCLKRTHGNSKRSSPTGKSSTSKRARRVGTDGCTSAETAMSVVDIVGASFWYGCNKHFMENIRAYNQMFAMTSFGAKIDESINIGIADLRKTEHLLALDGAKERLSLYEATLTEDAMEPKDLSLLQPTDVCIIDTEYNDAPQVQIHRPEKPLKSKNEDASM